MGGGSAGRGGLTADDSRGAVAGRQRVRFHMLRGLADENEVVTFGFFDGTLEELERSREEADYRGRHASIDPLVESVVANGVYEIVESWTKAAAAV